MLQARTVSLRDVRGVRLEGVIGANHIPKRRGTWRSNLFPANVDLTVAIRAPTLLITLVVARFPFIFNVILSFSKANLDHIRDWRLIGLALSVAIFAILFIFAQVFHKNTRAARAGVLNCATRVFGSTPGASPAHDQRWRL